jgi:hypothetical protein
MRIIGRDAPAVKLDLNFKAAFLRKRLRYLLRFNNYSNIVFDEVNELSNKKNIIFQLLLNEFIPFLF